MRYTQQQRDLTVHSGAPVGALFLDQSEWLDQPFLFQALGIRAPCHVLTQNDLYSYGLSLQFLVITCSKNYICKK